MIKGTQEQTEVNYAFFPHFSPVNYFKKPWVNLQFIETWTNLDIKHGPQVQVIQVQVVLRLRFFLMFVRSYKKPNHH